MLQANGASTAILFMVNTADGNAPWIDAVGRDRFLAGFPGIGGLRDDSIVRYAVVPALLQRTTLGEIDGKRTPRLDSIVRMLRRAGFPVTTSPNMDACRRHMSPG